MKKLIIIGVVAAAVAWLFRGTLSNMPGYSTIYGFTGPNQ